MREEEIGAAFSSDGVSGELRKAGKDDDLMSLVRSCVADGCPVVVAAAIGSVYVGDANGRVFINNAGLGLYPSVVHQREAIRQRLGRGTWSAFSIALSRSLLRYRLLRVRVRVKNHDYLRRTLFVFIGNNPYVMDGLDIGTRAALDEGVLSLYMVRRDGPFRLLFLSLRALLGRLRQAGNFVEFTATTVQVETRCPRELVGLDWKSSPWIRRSAVTSGREPCRS